MSHRLVPSLSAALLSAAALLSVPVIAHGAALRIETPIVSASPQTDVLSSTVQLHVPLPAADAPHPAACDWIQYERFRSASGPANPMDADSVVVLMPGVLEGATAFDPLARNTVEEAARRGRHIEVWAIDRRANCVEDHTGLDAVKASGNPQDAIGYYYDHQAIDGKTFAGWNANTKVLADIGIAQTMDDYNAVLTDELPSQPWREQHVICGGHSLGGPLMELYASWDFDGNAATTADAGYRQCAGFIGFDTLLDGGVTSPKTTPGKSFIGQITKGLLGAANKGSVAALRAGSIPRYVDALGISPETMTALELIGIRASQDPTGDATPLLQDAPRGTDLDTLFHLAGSPDLKSYATSKATIRDYRYTNAGLVGQILDDNGGILGIVRSSFGYFDAAALRRNNLGGQARPIPGLGFLVENGPLMLPQKLKTPEVVGWKNYDQLGTGANQIGRGITTPGSEVTDATQLFRILHEGPLNLTENDFPVRILTDLALIGSGDRSGGLAGSMHPRAIIIKPRIAVIAGNGEVGTHARAVDPRVVLPGYNHLDVLTAAPKQNNGQPEGSSQALANFIDQAAPKG